tara:strand:+ start:93 stop:254 length:162 start_codon:yes stop_codon:yes gene_type:complete
MDKKALKGEVDTILLALMAALAKAPTKKGIMEAQESVLKAHQSAQRMKRLLSD